METAKRYECQIYKKIAIESLQNCWKKGGSDATAEVLAPVRVPLLSATSQPAAAALQRHRKVAKQTKGDAAVLLEAKVERDTATRAAPAG